MIDSQAPLLGTFKLAEDAAGSPFKLSYSPALDGIRGLAILVVLAFNAHRSWLEGGYLGVSIFFVLSGFLVAGLIFREVQDRGRMDIKRFLIRRGLKIYPGFYCLIGVTVGIAVVNGWNLPWKRILSEVFFVQNYHQGLYNQTWSLGVEEHFYLLLPLLLLSFAMTQFVWLWIPFTVLAAAGQVVRNAMQRGLTAQLGTLGATHIRFLFGFPFSLMFLGIILAVNGDRLAWPESGFWAWLVVGGMAQILATALMLMAMNERSFVVTTAYLKTEAIQAAIFGFVPRNDPP